MLSRFHQILCYLILGMLVSAVVAWSSSVFVDVGALRAHFLTRHHRTAQSGIVWEFDLLQRGESVWILRQAIDTRRSAERYSVDSGPWWSALLTPPEIRQERSFTMFGEDARGWPLPCLVSEYEVQPDLIVWRVISGIPVGLPPRSAFKIPHALPIRPIWLGLLANTALYAVVAATVIKSLSRLRRLNRIKHSRCPRCGYPKCDAVACSECGSNS